MTPRSESLLWIQLLGLAALPLEVLLLLVLFAGADPGPLPALERLLAWGLGALLPAVLLWQRPADIWSLLLVQVPVRGRRPIQNRLSALQDGWALKLVGAAGVALLLPLTWWADAHAGLATGLSPFGASGRLVVLLLSVPLLALMLWQWQQALQATWLLLQGETTLTATVPLTMAQVEQSRLSLGLPLLLVNPLDIDPAPPAPQPTVEEGAGPREQGGTPDGRVETGAAQRQESQGSPPASTPLQAPADDSATATSSLLEAIPLDASEAESSDRDPSPEIRHPDPDHQASETNDSEAIEAANPEGTDQEGLAAQEAALEPPPTSEPNRGEP